MSTPGHQPADRCTIAQALHAAQAWGLSRLDAQRLLLRSLGRDLTDRAWLLGHDTDPIPPGAQAHFDAACVRAREGEPMGYLLGEQAFFGLTLAVDSRVLVPRPDTETLVEWALALWPQHDHAQVLDMGTGSGAIALALAQQHPQAAIHASDQSADALAVAQGNAEALGLKVQWHQGNWWHAVGDARFDLVVSNPPYIAEGDAHLPALRHEPRSALTAGPDGLDDLRAIIAAAPAHLHAGAWLLLEHGFDQGPSVAALLKQAGFTQISHRQDLADHVRCTGGQWLGDPKGG